MTAPAHWIVKNETLQADCRIFQVYKQKCRHPLDNREGDFFVVNCPDWVMALPITRDGNIVLVRQYRMGTQNLSWEPPGGILDPGENPVDAAARELREETGYAGTARYLGVCSPNPAILNNRSHFVLIENCERVGEIDLDENEEVETRVFTPAEVESLLANGEIHHAIAQAGLLKLHAELPNFFAKKQC